MISIRRFLYVALTLVVTGTTALVGLSTYLIAYHEVDELFDAQLAQNARLIGLLTATDDYHLDPIVMRGSGPRAKYERKVAVQRWSAGGELLLASASMPQTPLAPFAEGLSRNHIDGQLWHVFTLRLPDDVWLMVAESGSVREELARNSALAVTLPYIIAIPLILVLVTVAVRRGLKPLNALRSALERRDDRNLRPLRTSAAEVAELQPLEGAINRLLTELRRALAREQRFTADAAHELRTLLAVLKLHAGNAATLQDPQEVAASLDQLQVGVDRATRMVAQLLDLARVDHQDGPEPETASAVTPVVRQVLADLAPLADRRQQTLLLEGVTGPWRVRLRPEAMDMLFRNLVENALRYSPAGSTVSIEMVARDALLDVAISDEGEGVPPDMAERVTERFFRGAHDGNGAGLGLSIVARILDLVGGTLRFEPRRTGHPARTLVTLPLA